VDNVIETHEHRGQFFGGRSRKKEKEEKSRPDSTAIGLPLLKAGEACPIGGLHEAAIRLEANVPAHGLRDVLPFPRCSKQYSAISSRVTGLIGAASTFEVSAFLVLSLRFRNIEVVLRMLPNGEHLSNHKSLRLSNGQRDLLLGNSPRHRHSRTNFCP
jgi:hypothetical protein